MSGMGTHGAVHLEGVVVVEHAVLLGAEDAVGFAQLRRRGMGDDKGPGALLAIDHAFMAEHGERLTDGGPRRTMGDHELRLAGQEAARVRPPMDVGPDEVAETTAGMFALTCREPLHASGRSGVHASDRTSGVLTEMSRHITPRLRRTLHGALRPGLAG